MEIKLIKELVIFYVKLNGVEILDKKFANRGELTFCPSIALF